MQYHIVQAQSFWDCIGAMPSDAKYKAALVDTLQQLQRKPFQNPKLRTHGVGKASNGKKVYASDVGGKQGGRRVVWQLFNRTILLLLYGPHNVYDRIKRMRVDFDPDTQAYTIYEFAPDSGEERTYQNRRQDAGRLFMAWTDIELRSFGLPDAVVANLRRLDTDDQLLGMYRALGDDYFEIAYNLIAHGHPDGDAAVSLIVELEEDPTPPEVTEGDRAVERHMSEKDLEPWFTRTEPEFLADVMGRPIEDWMIFLHPDQRSAIGRRYMGPARVRGSAGTGKTVVGLHRAVWLAKRNFELKQEQSARLVTSAGDAIRPILFTTFIKTLPPVFESLYLRLPSALAGEVEFVNVDKLALQICREAGDRQSLYRKKVNEAFEAAYKRIVTPGSPLHRSGFTKRYVRDEITVVIKGRAIGSLDDYLRIARTGRRVPMPRRTRTQVWELKEAWDRGMARRGVADFPDVILRALAHARSLPEPRYSAVIVDEAQDITMAGLLFLRALVNAPHPDRDRPNGLLILGDGAQRIYPGGYTLRQAGIEVRGRTTVLSVNYRNTDQILGAAMAVAGDEQIQDLAEGFRRRDDRADTSRRGPRPLLVGAGGFDSQLDEIVRRIDEITADRDIGPGDIAVLVPANYQVKKAFARIQGTRFGVQRLDQYDGRPNDLVKVGTFHRGKGLEFKAVFLPDLTKGRFPRPPTRKQTVEEAEEARQLDVSALFVAMTRARDVLVLLYDGGPKGGPSETIADVTDRFEQQDPSDA